MIFFIHTAMAVSIFNFFGCDRTQLRNSIKLCHVSDSEPYLKVEVKNLGFLFPCNVGLKTAYFW